MMRLSVFMANNCEWEFFHFIIQPQMDDISELGSLQYSVQPT